MKKFFVLSLIAVLVVCMLTACSGDKSQEETTDATTEITTEITTELTTEKATEKETTTEDETTKAPETTEENVYVPVETAAPTQAPTKAPEITEKQEPDNKVNQFDDVEVKDKDRETPPTYPDGSFDMGAMVEQEGPGGYF